MTRPPEFEQALQRAQALHAQGNFAQAEQAYRQLATPGEHRETVLRALVELYMHTGQFNKTLATLIELTNEVPDELFYYTRIAALLEGLGRWDEAIKHYQRLLARQPGNAAAYFNVALLFKKGKRFAEAEAAFNKAIELGISDVQEVYANMGVLYAEMREREKAREMYERALDIEPGYIPALFNFAGLSEESGERERALELYHQILSLEPRHWDSLIRLAYAKRVTSEAHELVDSLKQATGEEIDDPLAREGLHFALGKALDDLGRYEEAFTAYRSANEMGKRRYLPYERSAVEQYFDRLIEGFSPAWIEQARTASTAAPIFICGMFRSGSTLIEQVLASHPSVTAGGELDYIPWLVAEALPPFPDGVINTTRDKLANVGAEYLRRLQAQFPGASHITDKRPDNFLFLALIKALFPAARIIYTKRNPWDNCLSIYFQQLGGYLSYATDLEDTAHYYQQHERLMAHWLNCFGENIFTVDYDAFVKSPEPLLRQLLDFLGLEWDDRCLTFQEADNLVQTASLWQVREALHTNASGRWRNYAHLAGEIKGLLTS